MERYFVLFALLLLGAIIAESVRHGDMDMCPKFAVKRNSIIRTKDSKARGAKMISKEHVDSARECFLLCCENEKCNVGILRYSHHDDEEDEGDRVSRKCYLFDCKEPNICVFVNHTSYAVIQLHRNPPKTPTEDAPISRCLPNVPVAMCAEDPCKMATCNRYPDAECKPNYCGGCNTDFFVNGLKVKCDYDVTTPAMAIQQTTTMKSDLADSLENGQSVSEEVEINPDEAGLPPTENYDLEAATADPYAVHEWRKFLTHPDEKKLYETTMAPITGHIIKENNSTSPKVSIDKVKYLDNGTTSVPLLIALIACIIVLIAVIWRLRCSGRGKLNKKFAVDDGDYLINGMYL